MDSEVVSKGLKQKIKALKKIQLESNQLEANFYKEVHQLENKYSKLFAPMYEKRRKIISGAYYPVQSECLDIESDPEEDENIRFKMEVLPSKTGPGLPGFWLIVFKNVNMLSDIIQFHDEPVLMYLTDVKVTYSEQGSMLEFHFAPNPYFTNTVLFKEYLYMFEVQKNEPFAFDGPEIYQCKGCKIHWKDDKDVTQKPIYKRETDGEGNVGQNIDTYMPVDSFFNFFDPPDAESDLSDEEKDYLAADFAIGHYIRERVVPRAVLFFTGQADELEESTSLIM